MSDCIRCNGFMATVDGEDACLICGYVEFGTIEEIAARNKEASNARRAYDRTRYVNTDSQLEREAIIQSWKFEWQFKKESGVIQVEYSVIKGGTSRAQAMEVQGWPTHFTKTSRLMAMLKSQFKAEHEGMKLITVEDCLDYTGKASWLG